jgi:endonuclease YncB( thermonuclease family)
MEIFLLFLAISAAVLAVRFIFSSGVGAAPERDMPSNAEEETFQSWNVSHDKGAPPQAPRFDHESAQPVTEKRVITGRAYVTDGDTITISKTQIRLFGIDAPELEHPYGIRAKRALQQLCKDQIIQAEVAVTDRHGRTVAHCLLPDGRDLSAEMVKMGLAIDWPKFSGGRFKSLETPDARKKLFLADARQRGRMDVWERFEAKKRAESQQP